MSRVCQLLAISGMACCPEDMRSFRFQALTESGGHALFVCRSWSENLPRISAVTGHTGHAHVLCSMQSITGQSEGRVEPKESRATVQLH